MSRTYNTPQSQPIVQTCQNLCKLFFFHIRLLILMFISLHISCSVYLSRSLPKIYRISLSFLFLFFVVHIAHIFFIFLFYSDLSNMHSHTHIYIYKTYIHSLYHSHCYSFSFHFLLPLYSFVIILKEIRKGLLKAAKTTGAWVFTGGTNTGNLFANSPPKENLYN